MSFTQSDHFTVDPSESQIAEGLTSPYGIANSHANCLPATVAQMIMAAGGPDIDPQQIENEVYGADHRGGSDWPSIIAWVDAHYPEFHFTYYPYFDFGLAEAAGVGGHLTGISGWCDSGPTFNPVGEVNGLSHASILWAHNPDDSFVIWNIWRGRFETYDRALITASLYEMAVLEVDMATPQEIAAAVVAALDAPPIELSKHLAETRDALWDAGDGSGKGFIWSLVQKYGAESAAALWDAGDGSGKGFIYNLITAKAAGGSVDLSPILTAIAAVKANVANDPAILAELDALAKHLGAPTL